MALEMHRFRKGSRPRQETEPFGFGRLPAFNPGSLSGRSAVSLQPPESTGLPEEATLVARALENDPDAIRLLMQRHNRRLYRVARSVLRDDGEAEDVLQEAYGRAFTHLHEFRGESGIGSWLARIVLNEAIRRLRQRRQGISWTAVENDQGVSEVSLIAAQPDPERAIAQRQIQLLLQNAIDELPARFRTVLVMRAVEGMSISETAEILAIRPETVKTRLHRARAMLRRELEDTLGSSLFEAFPFEGERCQRLTEKVLDSLKTMSNHTKHATAGGNYHSDPVLLSALGLPGG
jgi:RNA polymerase sigma-70 factor, ECF subfamily